MSKVTYGIAGFMVGFESSVLLVVFVLDRPRLLIFLFALVMVGAGLALLSSRRWPEKTNLQRGGHRYGSNIAPRPQRRAPHDHGFERAMGTVFGEGEPDSRSVIDGDYVVIDGQTAVTKPRRWADG